MGRVIFTAVITIAIFGTLIDSAQYLQQQNASFYCDFPDIPVVWDFESGIYSHHETLAFLDTSGRFYVDSATKYKLEKWVAITTHKELTQLQGITIQLQLQGINTITTHKESSFVLIVEKKIENFLWYFQGENYVMFDFLSLAHNSWLSYQ